MRRYVFAMFVVSAAAHADDASDIIRRSIERDSTNFDRLKNYTYEARQETREFDGKGKLKKTEVETSEILILGGRQYERLIARDDKPLSEKNARKEQERMDKELAKREHESGTEKERHVKQRAEGRKFLREMTDAFELRIIGEESVSGKPAWVIDAQPRPDYRPKDSKAKGLMKVRAKVWVDKADYQWVKAEAQVTDTLSFGLGLFRIAPGGWLRFEQIRVNDEVWLPTHITLHADARLAYLKKLHGELDITYRDYKKFQTDSRIISEK